MNNIKSLIAAAAVTIGFASCDFGPALIYQTQMPEFKPIDGKARVVILREKPMFSVSVNGGTSPTSLTTDIYVDAKFTSETQAGAVISFPVEAGEHYLVSQVNGFGMRPKGIVKLNFTAGKVYYLKQEVDVHGTPIGEVQTAQLPLLTIDEATKLIADNKNMKYGEFDKTKLRKDFEPKEFTEVQNDYAKWAKDKPKEAAKESNYSGY